MVYVLDDWATMAATATTPPWKRAIYKVARPVLGHLAARPLTGTIHRGQRVIGARGFPREHRISWVRKHHAIKDADVLVQGTGTGWDTVAWSRQEPRTLTGIDLYHFDSWPAVHAAHGINFAQGDNGGLPLADNSVDLIVSDAVYEHCRDLLSVMLEAHRVLRPTGRVYAAYGPLWFCAGGDHFSGRGGLRHAYNHLRLDDHVYREYVDEHEDEVLNFQSGGRYIELDLFSKLTTSDYLDIFQRAGFTIEDLIVEVSPLAVAFKRHHPAEFAALTRLHEHDDLLVKSNLVILRPTATTPSGRRAGPSSSE